MHPDPEGAKRRQRTWLRDQRLKRLGYSSYRAYQQSAEWRSVRRRYWTDADTRKDCAICRTDSDALLLHHKTYDRVGAEELEDLVALCNRCHCLVHELEKRGTLDLDFGGLVNRVRAARNRRERLKREQAMPQPTSENLRAQRMVEWEVALLRKQIAKSKAKQKLGGIRRCEHAIRRRQRELLWLRAHPDQGRRHMPLVRR